MVRIGEVGKTADDFVTLNIVALKGEAVKTEEAERTGEKKENNFSLFDLNPYPIVERKWGQEKMGSTLNY